MGGYRLIMKKLFRKLAWWWIVNGPDLFFIEVRLPYFEIKSQAMVHSVYSATFHYTSYFIKIWKWEFCFDVGDDIRDLKS